MNKKLSHTNLLSALLVICSFSLLSGCDAGYSQPQTYEEAKLTLEQQEQMNPSAFLTAEATYRENLIGQWVLEGTLISTATVAQYKDVVLTVHYYSKTETLLGSNQYTLYEYLAPGQRKHFKLKTEGYRGTRSVGMEVSDAVALP